ncbi:MAG: 50S ribosomal protein L17 [Saprospiraceae bacterium]|nr:50S ribosomal protein L17 [Saprospiraceae bacterium]MCB9323792.1 50S ribosomal protein L17 [Lewinellaceae bacterium]
MRHGKKFNHLGRKVGHRRALLRNLSIALITHKRINTTLAKAKALRQFIEPLLTKSKSNTTHSRRVVFSNLQNKEAIKELFDVIAEKIADRPGGYVRVLRTGFRRSDGAEMAMIELVDFNDVYSANQDSKAGGTSKRRRRGGSKKKATEAAAPAAVETAVEEVVEEAEEVVEDAVVEVDDVVEETTDEAEATEEETEEKE